MTPKERTRPLWKATANYPQAPEWWFSGQPLLSFALAVDFREMVPGSLTPARSSQSQTFLEQEFHRILNMRILNSRFRRLHVLALGRERPQPFRRTSPPAAVSEPYPFLEEEFQRIYEMAMVPRGRVRRLPACSRWGEFPRQRGCRFDVLAGWEHCIYLEVATQGFEEIAQGADEPVPAMLNLPDGRLSHSQPLRKLLLAKALPCPKPVQRHRLGRFRSQSLVGSGRQSHFAQLWECSAPWECIHKLKLI